MSEKAIPLLEQLRPFFSDEPAYGRLHADVHDLIETCAWFLKVADSGAGEKLDSEKAEDLLIELDVRLVDHGLFHLKSLKKEIKVALAQIADGRGAAKKLRGVA